jgi:poly-gamma-glutamate capsule biosynthesis protein CapA/YwtB (metallophosphatase superfamily)
MGMSRKKLIYISLAVLLIATVVGLGRHYRNQKNETSATSSKTAANLAAKRTAIRFVATGDMIPHDAINQEAKHGSTYDYYPMMKSMQPVFNGADIRFCNMAVPAGGSQFGISGYPVFNSPTEFIRDMDKVGCNVVNTASNHTNDRGQPVIDSMVDAWSKQPNILAVAGANKTPAQQQQIHYFTVKNVKFAFLAYSTYSNTQNMTSYGVNMFSERLAKPQITEARKNADIVIVSMRWGTEYSPAINASQQTWSQQLADWGADIVLGHGSHVVQPVKKLQGQNGRQTLVWYSLGNFLNAQLDPPNLFNGFAVMDIDPSTKQVTAVDYLPVYMHYEWTAAQKASQDLLARHDFSMYLFEDAAAPLARSQNQTTLAAQRSRINDSLNTYTPVPLITKQQYFNQDQ